MKAKAWGRVHTISAAGAFSFRVFFSRMYATIGAAELSVRTCCQLWVDGDTPPVLKESHQIQQRIETLIIQASKMGTAKHARHCCHLPLRIPHVLALLRTPGPGTRNAERNQEKLIGDHNF